MSAAEVMHVHSYIAVHTSDTLLDYDYTTSTLRFQQQHFEYKCVYNI